MNFFVYFCNGINNKIPPMKNEQISEILNKENLTASAFAEKTGIQRSAVSHLLSKRNKVSLDVVTRIHAAFPHISLYWLLDEAGEYYADAHAHPSVQTEPDASPAESDLFGKRDFVSPSGRPAMKKEDAALPLDEPMLVFPEAPTGSSAENIPSREKIIPSSEKISPSSKKNIPSSEAGHPSAAMRQVNEGNTQRKVLNIIVFYSDGTYETFHQNHH